LPNRLFIMLASEKKSLEKKAKLAADVAMQFSA
jgi:hypothetical protein